MFKSVRKRKISIKDRDRDGVLYHSETCKHICLISMIQFQERFERFERFERYRFMRESQTVSRRWDALQIRSEYLV